MTEENMINYESKPLVSIIMGAFNAEEYIHSSIDSIVNQDFENWEFIICDDGSTDKTFEICNQYSNKYPNKFIILRNEENRRLAATLNRCLRVARGKYIARMDADDISRPQRFSAQVEFLEANSNIDLVGTGMQRFDGDRLLGFVVPGENPTAHSLKRSVPFCHATIMARRHVFEQLEGYNEATRAERVEDADLWFRFFQAGLKGTNLKAPLYLVREDQAAFRRRTARARLNGFRTSLVGYRQLNFPFSWYVFPVIDLFKVLVPSRLQQYYRRFQERKIETGGI